MPSLDEMPPFGESPQARREVLIQHIRSITFNQFHAWTRTIPDEAIDAIEETPGGTLIGRLMSYLRMLQEGDPNATQLYLQELAVSADPTLEELWELVQRRFDD